MACDLGIKQFVKTNIGDKPWYSYKEDSEFIEIKASPTGKVNPDTFIGVARSLAKALNGFINKTADIGTVFYETLDYNGKVGVIIAPTSTQLKILNTKEDAERAAILAEEEENQMNIDAEHQVIEDKIRSGEIKQICDI